METLYEHDALGVSIGLQLAVQLKVAVTQRLLRLDTVRRTELDGGVRMLSVAECS